MRSATARRGGVRRNRGRRTARPRREVDDGIVDPGPPRLDVAAEEEAEAVEELATPFDSCGEDRRRRMQARSGGDREGARDGERGREGEGQVGERGEEQEGGPPPPGGHDQEGVGGGMGAASSAAWLQCRRQCVGEREGKKVCGKPPSNF